MRPLKLTMSAFGSYADVQEIDFAKLGASGLYLITGETGSGKTTIFDAVSFALFGRASGTGRDDYSMLRSDFAAEQARTYVELDFVSGGNRYSVRRSIRRAGQEAALRLPDGSTVGGDRAVRQKIAEIVGLDREQFAQIVMIAQNDFLRFLQSGTDERLKILRRIFGTEALRLFQERLKERARRESDRRELCVHSFERRGIDVYRRGEQFAEWEAQMAADGAELAGAEKRLGEYDEAKQALAAALAVAEELGRKLAALAACRAALAEHAARAGEIEGAKRRGARGAAALRNVKPLADEAAKAAASHGAAQAGLEAAKAREAAALAEREQAAKALGGLPPLAEAQAALAALAKEWEAASEKLKKLSRLRAGRDETAARQAALAAAQAELAAALRTLGGLPPLEGCQADAARLATELEAGAAALSRLAALRNDLGAIRSRQGGLAAAQAEFRAAAAAYDRASGEYEALNGIFLRNQAGVIASGLAAGAPCPVCGSTEHPAPAPPPEKGVTDAALKRAKDSWDRAGARREAQSAKCGSLAAEIGALARRFAIDLSAHLSAEAQQSAARENAGRDDAGRDGAAESGAAGSGATGSGGAKWGFAAPDGALPGAAPQPAGGAARENSVQRPASTVARQPAGGAAGLAADISGAPPADGTDALLAEKAAMAESAMRGLAERKAAAEKFLADLKAKLDAATKRRDALSPRAAALQGEIDTLAKRFASDFAEFAPYAGWEASEAALAGLLSAAQAEAGRLAARKAADEKALAALAKAWDAATKRKNAADADAQSAATLAAERAAGEQAQRGARAEAESKFMEALPANGFAGEAEYAAALVTEAELAALAKQAADYEKNGEQLARDIGRLEGETAGRAQPDLEKLRADSKAAGDAAAALSARRDEIKARLGATGEALKELRAAAADFEKAEKACAAVKQLAETANGRLDFETYAQTAYFERVLRAANQRLKLMSQERYTLLRKAGGGDGRKKSGLDIEALDAYTGKARPAGSLSGGESFMASLSLALGLSDVVQQSAGGIRLDAMFIDEGFGSLDADVLELAVRTLTEMAGANRIVGIISHVAELRDRIDRQIRVEKTTAGSKISLAL